jgi:hypothetical protein
MTHPIVDLLAIEELDHRFVRDRQKPIADLLAIAK